jgi:tRNA A37 threonylcarbamoyladenosine modification protein TsaB
MNILALDTSTPFTILAHCFYTDKWQVKSIQIEKMDKENDNWLETLVNKFTKNFPLEKFDGFAAGCGPGSFTGLRIGFTYFKALAVLWDKIFFSIFTADLFNSVFLQTREILLLQLNANLYATCDSNFNDRGEIFQSLEYWLDFYSTKLDNLVFWNFYNSQNPFPESLKTLDPGKNNPVDDLTIELPRPEYLTKNKISLRGNLPQYGLNVNLKRKNYA